MRLLDLTLDSVAANLALDEALLEQAERGDDQGDLLRLWESPQHAVILGRASRHQVESHFPSCQRDGIPVMRRCSGGATVMIGPGCLMYGVILKYEKYPFLRDLDKAHRFVMSRLSEALSRLGLPVEFLGTCDLTLNKKKFSGNSLRCKKETILYHGTLLYDFDLSLIGSYLGTPPRQPDYRDQRSHGDFVCNLEGTDPDHLKRQIIETWQADTPLESAPIDLVESLVLEKYSRPSWNLRL